jgi:hypothetical protein
MVNSNCPSTFQPSTVDRPDGGRVLYPAEPLFSGDGLTCSGHGPWRHLERVSAELGTLEALVVGGNRQFAL